MSDIHINTELLGTIVEPDTNTPIHVNVVTYKCNTTGDIVNAVDYTYLDGTSANDDEYIDALDWWPCQSEKHETKEQVVEAILYELQSLFI
jgi:hypothetical protein